MQRPCETPSVKGGFGRPRVEDRQHLLRIFALQGVGPHEERVRLRGKGRKGALTFIFLRLSYERVCTWCESQRIFPQVILHQVLIPVFALGRAQELCILLDTYWERLSLTTPIYFSAGLIVCDANRFFLLVVSISFIGV
jgi:hypothetical protein